MINVADIDHGYYAEHAVTLARHPSETDERMMVRLVALALEAHALQSDCNGDGTISFGKGLSDPDEPDVILTDFTGRKRRWIEVGQPDERPLVKACSQADAVHVYAFAANAEIWWRSLQNKVARLEKLEVWRLAPGAAPDLAAIAERSMQLHATLQEGSLMLGSERGSVTVDLERWKP